jgi:hypothetical protein
MASPVDVPIFGGPPPGKGDFAFEVSPLPLMCQLSLSPILALARSEAGSSAIMLDRSIPTSEVAPWPNRRVDEAIYGKVIMGTGTVDT